MSSIGGKSEDLWPDGEVDPLADAQPEAPVEAPVEVPAPVEPEVPVEEPFDPEEAILSDEEKTWKKRYDDTRLLQTRTAEERNAAVAARDEAYRLAQEAYAASQRFQAPPADPNEDPRIKALTEEAMRAGMDPDQVALAARIADAIASQKVQGLEQTYQQNQASNLAAMQNQQMEAQRNGVISGFRALHSDADEVETDLMEVLKEVGMVDETGFTQPELRADHLEVAYEIAKDPELRAELRANPHWYDTDAGMEYARAQAKLKHLISGATPASSSAPDPAVAAKQAELRNAQGIPASGGPPPSQSGSPQTDEFDAVLAFDQGKAKSVFSN